MDIERKAEIACTVLKWLSLPAMIICDVFAAFALLWIPFGGLLSIAGILAQSIMLFRQRDSLLAFLGWGFIPPSVVIAIMTGLAAAGAFPRIGTG